MRSTDHKRIGKISHSLQINFQEYCHNDVPYFEGKTNL